MVALIVASVAATILIGGLIGRVFGLKGDQSVLSAGAVGICGASAALAIASVLPTRKDSERNMILTVAGVTALTRLSHQSGNQVIWGSRNWNHEGKGADGAGVSDLWESKRVSCRMVGLRIA